MSQASFSANGKCVITASWDGAARVYFADSGKLLERAEKEVPKDSGN
jgi:hypothetical protein